MRPLKIWVAAIFAIFLSTSALISQELDERKRIQDEVNYLILNSRYSQLEELAQSYRDNDARTSSGIQKLAVFYLTIDKITKERLQMNAVGYLMRDQMEVWLAQHPNSPTAAVAKSVTLTAEGWYIRGGGYARTVDEEAWAPFFEKMNEANQVLLEAESYAAVDPYWHVQRAKILNHLNAPPEEFILFMDEALARHPNFFELHFAAVNYFAPKWHGDAYAIEAFAVRANEIAHETEGDGMYARIYWYASQTQFDLRLFMDSQVDWEKMRRGMIDVLAEYPDQWNIQNFALFSCLADDQDMTRELLGQMEGTPIMTAWKREDILDYCTDFAG